MGSWVIRWRGPTFTFLLDRTREDRTPRRTHMFLNLVGVVHLIAPLTFHSHMRVAQDMIGTCCTSAHSQKSSTHSMFHRPLLDVPHPCPSFCSTPPPSTPNSLFMDGIRRPSCATPPGRLLFGQLAESTPLTGFEPETCIDVSSEHTPINYPSRRDSFNIENNDLTTTVAAPEKTPTVFSSKRQPAAARSTHVWYTHGLAPTCAPSPGNGCEVTSQFQVLKGFCREGIEIEIWKVCEVCPIAEISMSTLNKKHNCLFKENAQVRKVYLRLGQKWTQEIGNKNLILPSMKPIGNSNLKDWSCVRRVNGQIRLREKKLRYVESGK